MGYRVMGVMGYRVMGVMGYRVMGEEKSEVESITVTYTDGSTTWSDEVHTALTVCTPDSVECLPSPDL